MKATLIASLASVTAVDSGWLDTTAKVVAIAAPVVVALVQALKHKPKKRSHKRKVPPAVVVGSVAALLVFTSGCTKSTFAESVRALSGDTNSWKLDVTCPLGGLKLNRNQP